MINPHIIPVNHHFWATSPFWIFHPTHSDGFFFRSSSVSVGGAVAETAAASPWGEAAALNCPNSGLLRSTNINYPNETRIYSGQAWTG